MSRRRHPFHHHWDKRISKYIEQEAKANARKKRKRPWRQVIKIGIERARKAGIRIPKQS